MMSTLSFNKIFCIFVTITFNPIIAFVTAIAMMERNEAARASPSTTNCTRSANSCNYCKLF